MAKKQATKTKRPAVAPEPTIPAPVQSIAPMTPRTRRLGEATIRGKVLLATSREFEDFSAIDMWAVVGLIDLLKNRECREALGASWIGRFICDELIEVSAEGVLAIENDPGDTLEALRECIEEFELNLKDARELAERYEEFNAIRACA